MISWYTIFNFSIISAALMLALLGLWFAAILHVIDSWSKRFFIAYFVILMLCSLVSLADMFIYQYVDITVEIIFGFFESLMLSLPLPMLTAYLLHCCRKNIKKNAVFRTVFCFWAVFFVLLVSTFFTKHIYYVSPDKQFQRGNWFPLLIIPLNAIMLLNLVCLIRWRKLLSRKYYFAFHIACFRWQYRCLCIPLRMLSTLLTSAWLFPPFQCSDLSYPNRLNKIYANSRKLPVSRRASPFFSCARTSSAIQ